MLGFHGQYLQIDLTNGGTRRVALPDEVLRVTLGGVGLGTWLLLQASSGRYDALSPEAPLVFAFAPLAGTALNTTAKAAVVSKSPLTQRLNDALISSRFALAGKRTGYDAIVLTGRASGLNTLFVEHDGIRIVPTPDLKGLSASHAEAQIRGQWGDGWSVAAIGPAGEAAVPFATLSHDGRHAGRGGMGAVMAAKGLKAIAVRGDVETATADPIAMDALRRALVQASLGPGTEKYRSTGTLGNLLVFNRIGILPANNFQAGSNPLAEQLSAERLQTEHKTVRATCADCMIGCERRFVDGTGVETRVEYENVYALGALIGNWNMDLVMQASRRCDELGLDTITMGGTIAFARECVQRGLLDVQALAREPAEFLLEALDLTSKREGYGALLALGSRALAAKVGHGSEAFAFHVKGLEMPGYHPGALQTLGLGFAVGARGADHNKSSAYDLDLSGKVDRFALGPERIEAMVELEDQAALMDSLILCKFVRRAVRDLYGEGAAMMTALTGDAFTPKTLHAAARAIHDLKKLFNETQGWTQDEDTLPGRFFTTDAAPDDPNAAPSAPAQPTIDRGQFESAKQRYYQFRGWSPQGRLAGNALVREILPH
jgi:aldehyde:ferredoxin oxidoreductase